MNLKLTIKRPLLAIAAGLVALAAAACGLPDDIVGDAPTATPGPNLTPTATETPPTPVSSTQIENELNTALAKWSQAGYANYDFTYRALCECTEGVSYTRISVRNREVVAARDVSTGGEPRLSLDEFRTIESLLSYIKAEINGDAATVEALFDETTGAPVWAKFDRIINAIDDELEFEVKNVERVDVNDELRQELLAAEDRWFQTGYANYDFTFRWICFCPPEYGKYARVSVRNGEVTSVTDAETGEPHPMDVSEFRTVDGLFHYIREEMDGSTEKIDVEFDETTGAPVSASFDRIINAIDDEIAFEVKDLEKVDVHTGTQEELDSARTAWESAGIANYGFTFEWICFCALEYVEPVRIEVSDGEIVAVTKADGDAIPQDDWGWYETIDGLFDLLQDAIDRDAASIQAEYKVCDPMPEYGSAGGAPTAPDNCSGYPANVSIDYDYRLADDERGFQVTNFESTLEPTGG